MGSGDQGRIDQGDGFVAAHEGGRGDAEHGMKLLGRHLQGSGRRRRSPDRLGKRGRAGGVEGDVALDLAGDLVDVAIEDSARAEGLEVGEMVTIRLAV